MPNHITQEIEIRNDTNHIFMHIKKIGENAFLLKFDNYPNIDDVTDENQKEIIFNTAIEALQYVINEAYKNSVIDYVESTTAVYICKKEIQEITNTKELIIH